MASFSKSSTYPKTFMVLGATGGTGSKVVNMLSLLPPTHVKEIRAIVRSPAKVSEGAFNDDERIKVIRGNAQDRGLCDLPYKDVDAVIYCATGTDLQSCHDVDMSSIGCLAKLAAKAKVKQFILLSCQLVHPDNRKNFIRGFLNSAKGAWFSSFGLMDFKYAGEQILRDVTRTFPFFHYLIIRPDRLFDGKGGNLPLLGQTNALLQGTKKGIDRSDLAAVIIKAAFSPEAMANLTVELSSDTVPSAQGVNIEELSAGDPKMFEGMTVEFDKKWTGLDDLVSDGLVRANELFCGCGES